MRPNEAPPEGDDPLLGNGPPGEADSGNWHHDPVTVSQRRAYTKHYVGLMKQLAGMAPASTDPKVAQLGGRIHEVQATIKILGGKV